MRVAELKVGLLLYFVGKEHIYVTLLDQKGHRQSFQLIRSERAFPLIDQLLDVLEGNYPATSRKSEAVFHSFSYEWGKELLPPSEYLRPFNILVIIPHHTLHSLPFHTIWLEEEKQFLATAFGITYCSSGTLFTRCVDRNVVRKLDLSEWQFSLTEEAAIAEPPSPRSCLSIGVDVKEDGQAENYDRLAKTFSRYFDEAYTPPLLASYRVIIKYPKYEALCIVSHGYYDPVLSDDSGLLLEGARYRVTRKPIYLHPGMSYHFMDMPFKLFPPEIETRSNCEAELMTIGELKVNYSTEAQLVALFGCSTGAGHLATGDDFNSLAYLWLKVGAASVLANLWKSDIEFINQWSSIFLEKWVRMRQPKAIAWQQALKDVLHQNATLKPYEWGVIALLGDWL